MGKRVSYPISIKEEAVQMRLAGIPTKEIMDKLGIKNRTQVKTWMKWYREGENHRFHQPVGKQYSYGKGPEYQDEHEKLKTENRFLKQQIDIFKKVYRMGKEVKKEALVSIYETVKNQVSISAFCQMFELARSSFYRWKKQNHQPKKQKLIELISSLCESYQYTYGYRKITALLQKEMKMNHKTVQRIMQTYGLQCRVKMKKRKQTGQPYYIAENHLKQDFSATKPFEKLVTDITYLPFGQKTLYLSSIKDLYTSEIVAYTIGDKQDVSLVLETLNQLQTLPKGCVLHSDQGSVYTSYAYQKAIKEKGITMSMSRKGMPADNAPIESFHSSLKSEGFYLHHLTKTTTAIVEKTVREYIDYYNNIRIQLKLNNQSPKEFRQLAVS
ncbi:IS3 family transposase [Bacillus sp. PDNC022]|uniref:IS3 family transposase n=1 Tax=Bacillus sp. PDNC022 TaxID=2812759 RepID=UPI001962D55C|nr:IS3 family transposase [Bacillus sp. PDNC022]QRY36295.1 IS3 family transposase [Bacillus sp. PDNC022]QRY38368.1 IS3 family transposase [Bacillus sp. PDNC022]QRY38395.1 IS3 family transposase [Bacillus sp. PDNC022]